MKKVPVVAALALFSLAAVAQETDLNYNFGQAEFQRVDIDGVDVAFTGGGLSGSWLVHQDVFLHGTLAQGQTSRIQDNGFSGKLSLQAITAGAGYRFALNRQSDLNLGGAFERQTLKGRGDFGFMGSESDNGFSLSAGMRYLVVPAVELSGRVTYIDVFDDDTLFTLGALGHVMPNVAVRGSYTLGSDWSGYNLGLRMTF